MFKREKKRYLEVNGTELSLIYHSLISWRNRLVREGRHTDPIDEMLLKLSQ